VKRIFPILLASIVFIGCSSENGQLHQNVPDIENVTIITQEASPSKGIRFTKEITYSLPDSLTDSWYYSVGGLGWFAGLAVSSDGNVFIGDYTNLQVHAFDADGSFLASMGYRGRGAGEFLSISTISILNDELHVFDPRLVRESIFSTQSMRLIKDKEVYLHRTSNVIEEMGLRHMHHKIYLLPNQHYLTGYMEQPTDGRRGSKTFNLDQKRPIHYFIKNEEGELLSTNNIKLFNYEIIFTEHNGRQFFNSFPLPFLNRSLISLSESSQIYTAWSDTAHVKVYDEMGAYVKSFFFPGDRVKLTREDALAYTKYASENTQQLLQYAELPEYWPALNGLIVDDHERLWVSFIDRIDDGLVNKWMILDPAGELLATFSWPDTISIEKVVNGHIFTLETQSGGVQTVVQYGFELIKIN